MEEEALPETAALTTEAALHMTTEEEDPMPKETQEVVTRQAEVIPGT